MQTSVMPRVTEGNATARQSGRKNVTFFISSLRTGGAEGVCVTLANALVARQWNVNLVVLNLDGATGQERLSKGVRVTVLGTRHARAALPAIWRYLRAVRPNLGLVFNHQIAVLLVMARLISGFKFRIVARNISTLSQKRTRERSFWHREIVGRAVHLLYRKVDLAIAQSEGMRRDLLSEYGFDDSRVVVIHNPVSEHIELRASRVNSPGRPLQPYFLCVGRLVPVKAFDYAIRAFGSIAEEFPGLRLKIVGSGPLKSELIAVADATGISDRVDMEGHQDDVATYYEGADATVLTSLYEGFPNVLVESISLGTPVIAFDCQSGPREVIAHGVNGFLVPYQDVDSLAMHMAMAVRKDWSRREIRASASSFKSERIVSEYEAALSK